MMRVLHITATHLNPTGGVVVVLRNLTETQNMIEGVSSIVLSINAKVDDVHSPFFYCLGKDDIGTFIKEHRPDLAIIHSFFYIEYTVAARALLREHIPFFIEPHGSFGKEAMKKSKLKKVVANHTVFSQLIKRSTGYIFTNEAEQLSSVYRSKNDLIIPNGVIPSVVEDSAKKVPASFDNPTLYFLGRYDIHHKGLDYLFDALDLLEQKKQKVKVNLYGTGDEQQMEYVRGRIAKYRILDVQDCGTIYGEAKKAALETCNILILTSRYEGSPMTVLDGLSYGNPCIATPGTNIADEIAKNHVGWYTELSAQSIAQTVVKALKEYGADGEGYYNRSKEYVLDNYSWEKIAAYSVEQYKRALQ